MTDITITISDTWTSGTLYGDAEKLRQGGYGTMAELVRLVAEAVSVQEPLKPGVYKVRLDDTMDRVFAQWDGHNWRTAEGDVLSWSHFKTDFAYLERVAP